MISDPEKKELTTNLLEDYIRVLDTTSLEQETDSIHDSIYYCIW
jgi:hypothetical protein